MIFLSALSFIFNHIILPVLATGFYYVLKHKKIKFDKVFVHTAIIFSIFALAIVKPGTVFVSDILEKKLLMPRLVYECLIVATYILMPLISVGFSRVFRLQVERREKSFKKAMVLYILVGLLFFVTIFVGVVSMWLQKNFVFSFQELLNTILNPMKGANTQIVSMGLKACTPKIILYWLCVTYLLVFDYKSRFVVYITRKPKIFKKDIKFSRIYRIICFLLCIAAVLGTAKYVSDKWKLAEYFYLKYKVSNIYEEKYVDPLTVKIENPEKLKNLILVHLESMETTYMSKEDGGHNDINYMPNLTQLAKENISFSDKEELLGGIKPASGSTWTIASIFSSQSGVPFAFQVERNKMSERSFFAPGITTFGDILKEKGYKQMFLCGSDAAFGGRDKLFTQHGGYQIYDLYTARRNGYIGLDYHVWWGYEDKYLFEIAKDEITKLASQEQPFNFTMLTVDTHCTGGYRCSLCGNEYENETGNIVACSDKQVGEFINWCKQQPFYEDTLIVLLGDHPRMDKELVGGVQYAQRTSYNCFINAEFDEEPRLKNRTATQVDMFPTILSALGFEIEGDKLGLGVDLFSDKKTIAEEMGFSKFDKELQKHSEYYAKFEIPKE